MSAVLTFSEIAHAETNLPAAPVALECENAEDPFIDTREPRLSWQLNDPRQGAAQTAYRVLVASSEAKLASDEGDLWDSGKVASDQSIFVPYSGKPLQSGQRAFWKVKTWDQDGKESPWSAPASWEMALLTDDGWEGAQWIARRPHEEWKAAWDRRKAYEFKLAEEDPASWPYLTQPNLDIFSFWRLHENPYDAAPRFRATTRVDKPVRRARVYICGLGYYELMLNGERVGDRQLDPVWTDYAERIPYAMYDVTDQLRQGDNAVEATLGRGFYGLLTNDVWRFHEATWLSQPKLRFLLDVDYADGSSHRFVSSPNWEVASSAVVLDDPRRGEIQDLRKDKSAPEWQASAPVQGPTAKMVLPTVEPIRVVAEAEPQAVTNPEPGVYVYDFGQHVTGRPRIDLTGNAGAEVLIRYSDHGMEKARDNVQPWQQHGVILSGEGTEVFEPQFSFTSFRSVILSGEPDTFQPKKITGVQMHTDLKDGGRFECSSERVNRIHQAVQKTLLANAYGLPMDIPHREKMGWMADGRQTFETTALNFDSYPFHRKWIQDMWDAQDAAGNFSEYAPKPKRLGHPDNDNIIPCWSSAGILVPWMLYRYSGDRQILEAGYDAMRRQMDFFAEQAPGGLLPDLYGDWLPPKDENLKTKEGAPRHVAPEGTDIYGTAYYYRCTETMAQIAEVLGHQADVERFRDLAATIKAAFNETYFDPEAECYRGEVRTINNYRQSPNAIALDFGLVPEDRKAVVVEGLLRSLRERKYASNTGILGSPTLLEALVAAGESEPAFRVIDRPDYPGWGHMVEQGTGHIYETWEACMGNGDDAGAPHQGLNSVGAFFYRHLAGIQPAKPGFKEIRLAPVFPEGLDWVKASYDSPYGTIRSEWKKQDGEVEWSVTVPPNTSALALAPQGYQFENASAQQELLAGTYALELRETK